jgi:PAS domain S-box-containing protein
MFRRRVETGVSNSVELTPEGFIRLTYHGAQTQQTLRTLTKQLFDLMENRRTAGHPVLVLADMRDIGQADSSARLEAKWFLDEADYDALAIIGNPYLKPFIFFVLRDFKSRKAVQYFGAEKPAVQWLLRSDHAVQLTQLKPWHSVKWAMPLLLALMLAITVVAWQQARARVQSEAGKQFTAVNLASLDAVNSRLQVYTDTLYGFRGLFHSSESVNEREYHDYFTSLDLSKQHPGFNSINYVTRVAEGGASTFIAERRSDRSLDPAGNPAFGLIPPNDRPEHFVVTYVGVSSVGSGEGVDLATSDERRATLEQARDSGQPKATASLQLFNQQGQEQTAKGFLMTIPIYHNSVPATLQERRQAHQGFVNAVFDYQKLFDQTFAATNNQVTIRVLDANGDPVYQRGKIVEAAHTANQPLAVANQKWTIEVSAPPLFGISRSEAVLPYFVLTLGISLTAFLAIVFWMLSRGRQHAISLASAMTEDIKHERNTAIATKNKDEAILSSIGDGVLVLDTQGRIALFNNMAEVISGFPAKEAIGRPYNEILSFYSEKTGSTVADFIRNALGGKRGQMARGTLLRRKDGTALPVADSAAPVHNADGNVIGAVVIFRDITKERQLERMKDEFLSVASHELRTPMGAVRANVSMILAGDYGPVNPDLVEPLTDIKSSTVRLVELVNDLLNVARIEAGRMKFTLSEFDIQAVVQSTANSLAPLGKEKNVAVTCKAGPALPVQADPDKVRQVLTNLIGNSLKFTSQGEIAVAIQPKPEDMLEVVVSDTGIGIAAADQQKLFAKFEQITSAQDGKPAGTGLGLYISREIIRKMGGDLWIKQSAPGKGSVFAFTLPAAKSARAAQVSAQLQQEAKQHPDQK